jgi:hypothetical protein
MATARCSTACPEEKVEKEEKAEKEEKEETKLFD